MATFVLSSSYLDDATAKGVEIWWGSSTNPILWSAGSITIRDNHIIEYRAKDGYIITSARINGVDQYNSYAGKAFTIAPDGLTARVEINWRIAEYDNFRLVLTTSTVEPEPEPEPVPNYLLPASLIVSFASDNISMNVNGVLAVADMEIVQGAKLELILPDDYYFLYAPTYSRKLATGSVSSTLSNNDQTATFLYFQTMAVGEVLTFDYYVETRPVIIPVNYKLPTAVIATYKALEIDIYVNNILAVADNVIEIGDAVKFVSYGEKLINSLTGTNSNGSTVDNFVISEDEKTATLESFPTVGGGFAYTFTNSVRNPPPKPVVNFVVLQSLLDALALDNLILYSNGSPVAVGDDIKIGDKVEFKITNNQIFISFNGKHRILGTTNFFTISPDEKTATLDSFPKADNVNYSFNYELKPFIITDIQGANDIYAVADVDVRPLIIKKYTYYEQNVNGTFAYTDFGVFILGFIRLPFAVDESLIGFTDEVRLGDKSTGVFADSLTVDAFTYDMGNITVPNSRGDFLDFKNTTALLHLPYTESVVIDVDYVIGETVRVEYIINAYDGVALINIYSSKIDGIVLTRNVDMGIKIPFANIETATPSRNSPFDISMGGDNGILKPFIELLRNDAILPDGFFTVPIVDESLISEQKGFIKVEQITLLSRANDSEIAGIESLLSKGIFIK